MPTNPDGGYGFIFAIAFTFFLSPFVIVAFIGGIFSAKRRNWSTVLLTLVMACFASGVLTAFSIVNGIPGSWLIAPALLDLLSIALIIVSKSQFSE